MADGTRLRTMEESLRKTETQLLEIQQFVATSKEFMSTTNARLDEHKKLIEEQGRKSDQQFSQMTEMLRMLLQKDQSPTASNLRNDSVQEPLDRGILGASSNLPEQGTVGTPPRSSSIASSHDLGDSSSLAASYEKQDRDVLETFPSRCNRGVHGFQEDVGAQKLVSFDSRMRENINAHKVFVERSRPSVHQFLVKSNSEFLEGNHEIPSPELPETDVNLNVKLVCDIVLVDSVDDTRTNSVDSLSAQQVFVIMSRRRKFTLVLGDKILALFARGLTLISSAVNATMKAVVDHSLPWDPGGYGVISDQGGVIDHSRLYVASGEVVLVNIVVEFIWVFDPGGV